MSGSYWNNQHNKHHATPQKLDHDMCVEKKKKRGLEATRDRGRSEGARKQVAKHGGSEAPEGARLRGCEAARLRGCEAARLRGCEAERLRGCEAARLRG
jgi:hypothetical protein